MSDLNANIDQPWTRWGNAPHGHFAVVQENPGLVGETTWLIVDAYACMVVATARGLGRATEIKEAFTAALNKKHRERTE